MLEPDQWDSVLANVKGTVVHGSERVSSNRYLREALINAAMRSFAA